MHVADWFYLWMVTVHTSSDHVDLHTAHDRKQQEVKLGWYQGIHVRPMCQCDSLHTRTVLLSVA